VLADSYRRSLLIGWAVVIGGIASIAVAAVRAAQLTGAEALPYVASGVIGGAAVAAVGITLLALQRARRVAAQERSALRQPTEGEFHLAGD
jgi:hypothetical protein